MHWVFDIRRHRGVFITGFLFLATLLWLGIHTLGNTGTNRVISAVRENESSKLVKRYRIRCFNSSFSKRSIYVYPVEQCSGEDKPDLVLGPLCWGTVERVFPQNANLATRVSKILLRVDGDLQSQSRSFRLP